LSIKDHYNSDIEKSKIRYDPVQKKTIIQLDDLVIRLTNRHQDRTHWLKKILSKLLTNENHKITGIYMWGGVGRGKTYLLDMFYEALPFTRKKRIHFHRFMQYIHSQMFKLQGCKNPLTVISNNLYKEVDVICLDEFFVSDIADAMILGSLIELLITRKIVLVATSNILPKKLYENGLQRNRFLPAIDLIYQNMNIINVDNNCDYRLNIWKVAEIYHNHSTSKHTNKHLLKNFSDIICLGATVTDNKIISVNNRDFITYKMSDDVVWFSFNELCNKPRSVNDYIEIAREFHTVIIEDIPIFMNNMDDQARRFINMIDEFYDRKVNVIISAATEIDSLYKSSGNLAFAFERTQSRLNEMQSLEYLSNSHKP